MFSPPSYETTNHTGSAELVSALNNLDMTADNHTPHGCHNDNPAIASATEDEFRVWAARELQGVYDGSKWKFVPVLFRHFMDLPAELRVLVIHEYLQLERAADRLSKHCHRDNFNSRCCVWDYPDLLIACDNQDLSTCPAPDTGRAPQGWLPALAFVSKTLQGEVTVHMLQHTKRIDLKYIKENPHFKIATWFREFLAAIPGGVNAVKYLNFPHMHWFNNMRSPPASKNPSMELVAACTKLRKLDMTWHAFKLRKVDPALSDRYIFCTTSDLVNEFKLDPVFECATLEEVYLDGIYDRRFGRPSDLDPLVGLAKWVMKGFLECRGQKVEIEVARRCGRFLGTRGQGTIVELNDKDLAEVEWEINYEFGIGSG
jgi:hypothetical protein